MPKLLRQLLPLVLPAMLCGCGYQVREQNGAATIHFGNSTYVGLILIPLILALIAVWLAVFAGIGGRVVGGLLLGLILLVSATILPGVWIDRVTLDAQGLTQQTGFWWSPTIKGFKLAEVREIRIVRKPSGPQNDISNHMSNMWEIHQNDGTTRDIDPGDLWDNATDYLVAKLRERGVQVQDSR